MYNEPIHPWRWRALALFLVVWLGAWIVFGHELKQAVHDVRVSKANVASLQKTNCGLKNFMIQARNIRAKSALHARKKIDYVQDVAAVRAYMSLERNFDRRAVGEHCESPALVKIRRPKHLR